MASMGHGAAVLVGLAMLTGLGTDAGLDSNQKGKGIGMPSRVVTGSRHTATTLSDASRFANQLSPESGNNLLQYLPMNRWTSRAQELSLAKKDSSIQIDSEGNLKLVKGTRPRV